MLTCWGGAHLAVGHSRTRKDLGEMLTERLDALDIVILVSLVGQPSSNVQKLAIVVSRGTLVSRCR